MSQNECLEESHFGEQLLYTKEREREAMTFKKERVRKLKKKSGSLSFEEIRNLQKNQRKIKCRGPVLNVIFLGRYL